MSSSSEIKLYTIGYEGRSVEELLNDLIEAEVQCLVDVRELPLSRKKGFSKTALGEELANHEIAYVHVRKLGNPKENRERYWSGNISEGAEVFKQILENGSRQSLLDLATELTEKRVCLLCFERDHQTCHRAVIVNGLTEINSNLSVTHL